MKVAAFRYEGKTEEELDTLFKELRVISKSQGNPHKLNIEAFSRDIREVLRDFENLGWIYDYDAKHFSLNPDYIFYPSAWELLGEYEKMISICMQTNIKVNRLAI